METEVPFIDSGCQICDVVQLPETTGLSALVLAAAWPLAALQSFLCTFLVYLVRVTGGVLVFEGFCLFVWLVCFLLFYFVLLCLLFKVSDNMQEFLW